MSKSFYKNRIEDKDAIYFPVSDGSKDISDDLYKIIEGLKLYNK